jgi:hypothetical protein
VVRACQRGLEIAQHGVDPIEFWQVAEQQVAMTMGMCMQPASATNVMQPSPSLRTQVPGSRLALAR